MYDHGPSAGIRDARRVTSRLPQPVNSFSSPDIAVHQVYEWQHFPDRLFAAGDFLYRRDAPSRIPVEIDGCGEACIASRLE